MIFETSGEAHRITTGSMEIEELGYVICSHSDSLETNHNKPCIYVSSYTTGDYCD